MPPGTLSPPISDTARFWRLPRSNLSHATKDERIAIAFGRSLHNATRPHRNRFSAIANPCAALSEDDSSDAGGFCTPPRDTRKSASAGAVSDPNDDVNANGEDFDDQDEDGEVGEEDEDLEENEYVVEEVKKHIIDDDGSLKFQVKWEGYNAVADMTWEPEENLQESASETLQDTTSTAKRSRRGGAHPADTTPPATAKKWSPPAGSWEDEIETIDACEEEGSGKLVVYLIWKNGNKTKHDTQIIYKKCPQKMLQFYERHVKIIREEQKAQVDEAEG
ncbi:hypothetical protein CEP52_011750 [Fusarium oligoseptatum]|uniref:Chromo domain-containing protein n=1 Tax=Fusarium oligoseptatum TaxID=2604345 RepID=A0A428T1T9_9HYPO|nr:hypothetical protein CEP52_011750 [Fusarium oligoseptatum]